MKSLCYLAFCGYLPSTHPLNQRNNYPESLQAGDMIYVRACDIEMLLEVTAEDVVKDCKVYTSKSSANENEKKKAIEDFGELHGKKYIGVQLKSGRHVYARATIEEFHKAFAYSEKHPECVELDLDQLPAEP